MMLSAREAGQSRELTEEWKKDLGPQETKGSRGPRMWN